MKPLQTSGLIPGTFFLCLGLLAYEIFCSRLLAIVVGNHMLFFVIAIAMLGTSAAATWVSLGRQIPLQKLNSYLYWMSLSLGVSLVLVLIVLTALNSYWNDGLTAAAASGGMEALVQRELETMFTRTLIAGSILCIPYFIFGAAISTLFRTVPESNYHRLYFSDLAGAAIGCGAVVVGLELLGFQGGLIASLLPPFLASLFFAGKSSKYRSFAFLGGLLVLVSTSFSDVRSHLEPVPNIEKLTKNAAEEYQAETIWSIWNSFTRVAFVSLDGHSSRPDQKNYFLGLGDGMARMTPYIERAFRSKEDSELLQKDSLANLITMYDPSKVLVILAGAGGDMIAIDELCKGQCDITGVELNRQMINHAINLKESRLGDFLQRDNIRLIVAEGREFLEREQDTYDAILLSYSGASFAYYAGTSGNTIQYIYTKESYEALLDKLNPNGVIVVANTNKALLLSTLREIYEERGLDKLIQSVVIAKAKTNLQNWDDTEDFYRLVLKKSPFSNNELQEFYDTLRAIDYEVVLAPDSVNRQLSQEIYEKILQTENPGLLRKQLVKEFEIDLKVRTDNSPFVLDLVPSTLLLTPWKWDEVSKSPSAFKILLFILTLVIIFAGVLLIVCPLLLSGGPSYSHTTISHFTFFGAIGLGFMFIEVALAQKLGLLLGHPGLSLALVLGALVFFTGVGSLLSDRAKDLGVLSFGKAAIAIILILAAWYIFGEIVLRKMLSFAFYPRALLLVLLLAPLGIFAGYFMPQGLKVIRKSSPNLVAWAWAINGVASTAAAALAVSMAPSTGFSVLLLCGATCYAIVLLLPDYLNA